MTLSRVPRAVQRKREGARRCTADAGPRFAKNIIGVPGLQRITPLRFVLRCARDTR